MKKSFLWEHYIQKKESMNKIARGLGCAHTLVDYWMKKFQIPKRSYSEAHKLARSNHVSLSVELIETLNGLMLGDGHLSLAKWSSCYMQSSKFRDFLVWLSKVLAHHGIGQVGRIRRWEEDTHFPGGKIQHTISFSYNSRRYVELKSIHSKWYRKAREDEKYKTGRQRKYIKVVPLNLELTPLTCLMWYLGDGYLGLSGRQSRYVLLCTQSFTVVEIYLLTSLLKSLGFMVRIKKDKSIRIPAKSTEDFFDYIGPCPKEIKGCLGYRWKSYD